MKPIYVCQTCLTVYDTDRSRLNANLETEVVNDGCCVSHAKPNIAYISLSTLESVEKQKDELLEVGKYLLEKLYNGSSSERIDATSDLEKAIKKAEQ